MTRNLVSPTTGCLVRLLLAPEWTVAPLSPPQEQNTATFWTPGISLPSSLDVRTRSSWQVKQIRMTTWCGVRLMGSGTLVTSGVRVRCVLTLADQLMGTRWLPAMNRVLKFSSVVTNLATS
uniref:Secreted protein n=1 Tax=Cacopsylla melanoneura TaxID=428564 RepID=A0A8D9F0U5_9HEMI